VVRSHREITLRPLGGVVKRSVVNVVDGCRKLVAGDGCHDQVGIQGLLSGKVGSVGCFMGKSSSRGIDGILRGSGHGDYKHGPIVLKVEDRVLEEAKMSSTVSPRARNGHEVGGQFLLKDLQLFVISFSVDAGEGCMGHLGPDGLGGDSVQHGFS
jgi:hypothetical protein